MANSNSEPCNSCSMARLAALFSGPPAAAEPILTSGSFGLGATKRGTHDTCARATPGRGRAQGGCKGPWNQLSNAQPHHGSRKWQ